MKILFFIIITWYFYSINDARAFVVKDVYDAIFDIDQFVADGAVKLFKTGCLDYYKNQSEFEAWVKVNNFRVIPGFAVSRFLNAPERKAYSIKNKDIENGVEADYVLAVDAKNRCSVFVKDANHHKILKTFAKLRNELTKSNLTSTVSSTTQKLSNGRIKTTEFQYYKNEKWYVTLELVESSSKNTFYNFIMTAITQERKDNLN